MDTVRLSSKGQFVLPNAVRNRHGWREGVALSVEDRGDEVVLREASPFAPTVLEPPDAPSLRAGKPLSLSAMKKAVAAEAGRRR